MVKTTTAAKNTPRVRFPMPTQTPQTKKASSTGVKKG